MANSTVATTPAPSPDLYDLGECLAPHVQALYDQVRGFRERPLTPEQTAAFEKQLALLLRAAGRAVLEHEFNRIEPQDLEDCPLRLRLAGQEYRRRPKSPNRIGTLF